MANANAIWPRPIWLSMLAAGALKNTENGNAHERLS
jgi:hypothetical protein